MQNGLPAGWDVHRSGYNFGTISDQPQAAPFTRQEMYPPMVHESEKIPMHPVSPTSNNQLQSQRENLAYKGKQQEGLRSLLEIKAISTATHDELLLFENPAYQLKCNEVRSLRDEVLVKTGSSDAARKMYMDLLATKISHEPTPPQQSSTTRLFSRPSPSPLKEENYPKIRFWQEDAYTKLLKQEELDGIVHDGAGFKGRVAISKGYNVKNRYIEHSDGTVIDGHRLDRAFEKCHELFWQVEGVGLLPATWKQMRADVVAFIFTELELDFPELQLCELHWKARRLAHYKFGTWYNDNKKKFSSPNVKQEASTAPAIPDAILPAVKRSRSSTDDGKVREEKKSKVTAVASSQGEIHPTAAIPTACSEPPLAATSLPPPVQKQPKPRPKTKPLGAVGTAPVTDQFVVGDNGDGLVKTANFDSMGSTPTVIPSTSSNPPDASITAMNVRSKAVTTGTSITAPRTRDNVAAHSPASNKLRGIDDKKIYSNDPFADIEDAEYDLPLGNELASATSISSSQPPIPSLAALIPSSAAPIPSSAASTSALAPPRAVVDLELYVPHTRGKITAKNLYGIDFTKDKAATKKEFEAAWRKLSDDEKERYGQMETAARAARREKDTKEKEAKAAKANGRRKGKEVKGAEVAEPDGAGSVQG